MYSEATTDFETAVSLNPDEPSPYHSLINAYLEQRRLEDALIVSHKALEQLPSSAGLHHHRGWVCYQMGNVGDAMKNYNKALELDSTLPEAHNDLGIALLSQGETDKATEHYTKAIDYGHPKLTFPYSNRGEARALMGDLAGALSDCSEAIRIDASYPNAFRIRAEVNHLLQNVDEAIADYEKYIELGGWRRYNDREEVEATISFLKAQK